MLLSGDVGGTKTLLGLFREASEDDARPAQVLIREYATLDFDSLDDVVRTFAEATNTTVIDAVAIGVAGPVTGHTARLTNVPWLADISAVSERFHRPVNARSRSTSAGGCDFSTSSRR